MSWVCVKMSMSMFFWVKKVVPALIVAADGSGDYTDIQSAVDALPATGGLIMIKQGTYTIATAITIDKANVVIQGSGYTTLLEHTSANTYVFDLDGGTRTELSNMRMTGTTATMSPFPVFHFTGCSDSLIERCWLEAPKSSVLEFSDNVSNVTIKNCFISSIYNYCIYFPGANSDNNKIIDNFISGPTTGETIYVYADSDNNLFSGNTITGTGTYGIHLGRAEVDNNIIINNVITGYSVLAIFDEGTGTVIGHNITS